MNYKIRLPFILFPLLTLVTILASPICAHSIDSVLLVGDSHIFGPMGEELHKQLNQKYGPQTFSIGAVGATASSYADLEPKRRIVNKGVRQRTGEKDSSTIDPKQKVTLPTINELIDTHKPNLIVLELGDNFASYNDKNANLKGAQNEVLKMKQALQNSAPHTPCIWVTPLWTDKENQKPYFKTNARLTQIINTIKKEVTPRCQVIDSTTDLNLDQKLIKTGKDGLHYTKESGVMWADAVSSRIQILMNTNTKTNLDNPTSKANGGSQ